MIGHNHLGKNGRFGNQMFQYAATRGIAAKHNYDWCIPVGPKEDEEFDDDIKEDVTGIGHTACCGTGLVEFDL